MPVINCGESVVIDGRMWAEVIDLQSVGLFRFYRVIFAGQGEVMRVCHHIVRRTLPVPSFN